jgi:hypothetical protein
VAAHPPEKPADSVVVRASADHAAAGRDIIINQFFSGSTAQYRLNASTSSPDSVSAYSALAVQNRRHLVVLVHGLYGDAGTWKFFESDLALLIATNDATSQCRLGGSVCSWRYQYPAKLFQPGDIYEAADDLLSGLTNGIPPFESYSFVCHSAGGLVVKRALTKGYGRGGSSTERAAAQRLVVCRTAVVMDVGVPHWGASDWITAVVPGTYDAMYTAACPLLIVAKFASGGKLNLGRNRIIYQLTRRRKWLHRLEQRYQQMTSAASSEAAPMPLRRIFMGRSDLFIRRQPAKGATLLNGPHFASDITEITSSSAFQLGRLPSVVAAPIVRIAEATLRLADSPERWLAMHTFLSVIDVERSTRVSRLLDGSENREESQLKVQQALERVSADVRAIRVVVVTGPAGVGKSTVVRAACRRLAGQLMAAGHDGGPRTAIPYLIELKALDLLEHEVAQFRDPARTEEAFTTLLNRWLTELRGHAVANIARLALGGTDALAPPRQGDERVTIPQLTEWLDQRPVVLALDGIDEFTLKYDLSPEWISRLVTHVTTKYEKNVGLTVVLGVREGFAGAGTLPLRSEDLLSMGVPTVEEAGLLCPCIGTVITHVGSTETRNILLTPLLLVQLCPWLSQLVADETPDVLRTRFGERYSSRSDVLSKGLEVIISSRPRLTKRPLPGNRPSNTTAWLDALGAIAYSYYESAQRSAGGRFLGARSVDEIIGSVAAFMTEWRNAPGVISPAERDAILDGFSLVSTREGALTALLHTVFRPSGMDRFQFAHDSWQEVLTAWHMARSLEAGVFSTFDKVFFHPTLVYMAGNLLGRRIQSRARGGVAETQALSLNLVSEAISSVATRQGALSSANVLAIICGNERGAVPPYVIATVMGAIGSLQPVAAMVTMNAIGHLGLIEPTPYVDPTAVKLAVSPYFGAFDASDRIPPILRDLAYDYLEAYGQDPPRRASMSDADPIAIATAFTSKDGDQAPLEADEWRSLSRAFLGLVRTVQLRGRTARGIASVYYLFVLAAVVATRRMAVDVEVLSELRAMTTPGSEYLILVESVVSSARVLQKLRTAAKWIQTGRT